MEGPTIGLLSLPRLDCTFMKRGIGVEGGGSRPILASLHAVLCTVSPSVSRTLCSTSHGGPSVDRAAESFNGGSERGMHPECLVTTHRPIVDRGARSLVASMRHLAARHPRVTSVEPVAGLGHIYPVPYRRGALFGLGLAPGIASFVAWAAGGLLCSAGGGNSDSS